MLRLVSRNVAGRVEGLDAQVDTLIEHGPDVIALQEVTAKTGLLWRNALEMHGYWVTVSLDLAPGHELLKGGRKYGVLTASRWAMKALPPTDFDVPWTERILSVVVDSPWGEIECRNAHLPHGGIENGLIKVKTFEGIYERLRCEGTRPRILCGDFNSPQEESVDGTTIPFGTNKRWSAAELSVITGLGDHDLKDVFRFLNGFGTRDVSHVLKNRGREYRHRFDHIFASQRLNATACAYLHTLGAGGLGDHAPIEARFEPG